MKYIIANWKAHKTLEEARTWMQVFSEKYVSREDRTVIICVPHPFLYPTAQTVKNMTNVFVGAQDLSIFEEGSHTGEVVANHIASMATYVMLGHSERRRELAETNDVVMKKVSQAKAKDITPIVCVRGPEDVFSEAPYVVYEPVGAIGTGANESLEKTIEMKGSLNLPSGTKFLYGGSVDPKNCASYTSRGEIDGVLVGTASLDPEVFAQVVEKS
jgi:triosephosphate isomerase (TIM)